MKYAMQQKVKIKKSNLVLFGSRKYDMIFVLVDMMAFLWPGRTEKYIYDDGTSYEGADGEDI
jgi:hypothetical protein